MKFNIISPTRLQVDVYAMNLQLNFEAIFFCFTKLLLQSIFSPKDIIL